jgi:AraC-like DNA-binding protein
MKEKAPGGFESAAWRRESLEGQRSEIVAGRVPGPMPPGAWAFRLRTLIDASQKPEEGPSWWNPAKAYFGSVETRTDPRTYFWDGMKRAGRHDHPVLVFQFTFAGFGHFELYGQAPERIVPGTGFFATIPSRHRYYLPESSPGWTFAWIGIYHPYLLQRILKQVAATGHIVQAAPNTPFVWRLMRLARGAFRKDFADRFEVEQELFAFTLAYERLAQEARNPDGEQLLDELRKRVLADPRRRIGIDALARERGVTPSAYSHYFRARTGVTPARFMNEARVQLASRMLVTTRLPLARIAEACGFANANHFGKVFRRFRPQSAGGYRRSVG